MKIELLTDKDNKEAYQYLLQLENICETSNELYEYFDIFLKLLSNEKTFVRVRGFRLICSLAKWDIDNKINDNIEIILNELDDQTSTSVRQCLKALNKLLSNKKELKKQILTKVSNLNFSTFKTTMQELIQKDIDCLINKNMKIAVFSDIHGNLFALKSIIEDIKKHDVDRIICLGDTVGLGPNPQECLNLIEENKIEMILGNHDLYCVLGVNIDSDMSDSQINHHNWVQSNLTKNNIKFLKKCPLQIVIKNILFEHFLIKNKKSYPYYSLSILKDNNLNNIINKQKYDYVICGHEHIAFELNNGKKTFMSVGSSGCTKDNITSYLLMEINDLVSCKKIFIKYDRNTFLKVMKVINYPEKDIIKKNFFGIDN